MFAFLYSIWYGVKSFKHIISSVVKEQFALPCCTQREEHTSINSAVKQTPKSTIHYIYTTQYYNILFSGWLHHKIWEASNVKRTFGTALEFIQRSLKYFSGRLCIGMITWLFSVYCTHCSVGLVWGLKQTTQHDQTSLKTSHYNALQFINLHESSSDILLFKS